MGENINLLSERIIGNKAWGDGARLELAENIHFHYRNFRYVFDGKNFYNIAEMFERAKQEYIKLGKLEFSEGSKMLGETPLIGNGFYSNRVGCELTLDGTIHIHYRDLRIHLKQADFLVFAEIMRQGMLTLCELNTKVISLEGVISGVMNDGTVNSIIIPEVAKVNYLKMLKEYDEGKHENVLAEDVIKYYMEVRYNERGGNKNIQRHNGLPEVYPCTIPCDIDKKYLFAIYESIKKYGYAKGPFLNEHIVAYKMKDDKIYITGAHRVAALIHLGYKEITVILIEQESSG